MTDLTLNPNIAAAPLYVGGAAIADIQRQYSLEDIVKLASNESPLGPSPKAIAAMQQAAAGLNRYPPIGDEALREELARLHHLSPDNFVTGNGGCDILNMLATAFLGEGSEAAICRPTFPVYDITARRAGAGVVYVDLNPDDFGYDVEAILAAVSPQTRLVYVCSPNNPTGSTIGAAQLDALLAHLPPHVVLVMDEVYYHFAAHHPDTLAYVRQGKNIVVLHSFSKAYGLAGLRLGYGIAPEGLAGYLSRARLPFHLSQFTVRGGVAALQDIEHVDKGVEIVREGRGRLLARLAELPVRAWPSEANFILFKPPFDAAEVSERLLRRGVIVRPMGQFYLPTHLRVTIGLPAENERFVAALAEVLAELRAEGAAVAADTGDSDGEFRF
ncbi:MAG: histidinol-phosphate transaminase [Anaerolineae bacterium]